MPKRSHPSWKGRFVMAPKAGDRAQSAVVKVRLVHRGHRGLRSLVTATALELHYMEKGDRGHASYALYQGHDVTAAVDRQAFAAHTRDDPYQWRLWVSPERGQDLDLTSLTRRTMVQMEQDTGYRLEWVAANHYDTGQPHTHILLRGRDLDGQDVGLTRDYLSHGLRYRVQDLVTQDLGLRERAQPREQTLGHDRGLAPERPLGVWRYLPRETPVGGGLRARLDPELAHDRGR